MSEISEKLKDAISESGFSFRELENMTGIPHSAIQRYSSGATDNIPLGRLSKLASVLGQSPAYFMGWDDGKPDVQANNESKEEFFQLAKQTAEEQRLLELWRKADGIDKQTIWSILSRYDEESSAHSSLG